ncbi:MAG: hypothetical protein IPG51_19170 [Chloroflexi bacterium]|nr:hypothetical protein [Chloroflexota bacterium]
MMNTWWMLMATAQTGHLTEHRDTLRYLQERITTLFAGMSTSSILMAVPGAKTGG